MMRAEKDSKGVVLSLYKITDITINISKRNVNFIY